MTDTTQYNKLLSGYLPPASVELLAKWFSEHDANIKITRPRSTKLGDYRHPCNGKPHRISINGNLNSYAFLITLTHEFAHLLTWTVHKRKVKPHGTEWKNTFRQLMQPFLLEKIFPGDMLPALKQYLDKPGASGSSEHQLVRILRKYDDNTGSVLLEELPVDTLFRIKQRIFQKGGKLRKRYKCKDIKTGKFYYVSPVAEVQI